MNLTIDIGNTCTKLVAFNGTLPIEEVRMDMGDWSKLSDFCLKHKFDKGIYSSVVKLSSDTEEILNTLPFPMLKFESGKTPIPIINKYATPNTLGGDRLAAAIGAYYKNPDNNILIIDVGTCITYDFVTSNGEYIGGNISPGPTIRFKSLRAFTSSLPLIERKGNTPEIGNSTETAIRCGVMKGIEYEIEGYINEYLLKYPNLLVYLTGGVHLNLHITEKKCIFADNYIVPEGLNRTLLYNDEIKK